MSIKNTFLCNLFLLLLCALGCNKSNEDVTENPVLTHADSQHVQIQMICKTRFCSITKHYYHNGSPDSTVVLPDDSVGITRVNDSTIQTLGAELYYSKFNNDGYNKLFYQKIGGLGGSGIVLEYTRQNDSLHIQNTNGGLQASVQTIYISK